MRLQQKILLIILPLILVPIIVLGIFAYKNSLDVQEQLEEIELTADIQYRVSQVNSYRRDIMAAMSFLASNKQFPLALSQSSNRNKVLDAEKELRHFAYSYPDSIQLALLDRQGKPIGVHKSNKFVSNPLALTDRVEWQLINQDRRAQPLIGIQQPIFELTRSPRKRVLGFINIILMPDWERKLKLMEHHGDKFMISDLTGNLLFSYPEGEMGSMIPSNAFKKLYNATKQSQASMFQLGSNQIHFSGQLISGQYLFLYGKDKGLIKENKSGITWVTLIIVLLTIAMTSFLVYYSINNLVILPIMQLAQAKQKVAQGQFDIKLNTESHDEFGELFASFNVMVRQLVVYREKERDGRLRLEYKVKERTEELLATNTALEASNIALEKAKITSEQASELKSAFVANMSHEIRTPLTAILGFTEQVIANSPTNSQQLDLLGRVLSSGKHLLALINNVLEVSKIEADKLDIEVTKVDLFELFNDVVGLLSTQASDKNVDFIFNYIYPIPHYIRTDSTRLKQILLNLASNAIKFTETGSIHIDVKYLPEKSSIEVIITDTGIGMSEEVAQSLFQPFMQADVSISRRFGGTGLGLVISKNLAKILGGDIRVTSELGKGSEFIFNFKVTADNKPLGLELINSLIDLATDQGRVFGFSDEKAKAIAPVSELSGRVLVAEDVEDNQFLFKLLLDSLSVDYEIVSNGEQAVERALTDDFDLILMDMQMPIIGGLEATSLLRQAGVDTPIYALTANVMKDDMQRHLNAGCNGTIAKPIDRKEFISIVQSVLGQRKDVEYLALPQDKLDKLRHDYLSQLPAQAKLISKYLTDMDLLGLMAELHKVKGSAGSYGFMVLSSLAGQVEAFCLENKEDELFWPDLKSHTFTLLDTMKSVINAEGK
jgi:signal transduction histidine kinase/CheY-like chemotaxis protein